MDREIWGIVLDVIKRAARAVDAELGGRAPRHPNWPAVAMCVWAVPRSCSSHWTEGGHREAAKARSGSGTWFAREYPSGASRLTFAPSRLRGKSTLRQGEN